MAVGNAKTVVSLVALSALVVLVAASWSITQPRYVHLAMNGTPTGMYVSWWTVVNTTSIVQYGTSSGDYDSQATGYTLTYVKGGGYHHHAELTGLSPSTTYYYRVGDNVAWSQEFSFVTPPDSPREFTIGVYGDMGVVFSQDTMLAMHEMTSNGTLDWVFHVGDISYADDYAAGSPELYEPIWNMWFEEMQPTTSSVPYMVLPGNHEYSCENNACTNYSTGFIAYNNRFIVPHTASNSPTNMWYSFDYAGVHFVAISTETDYPGSPYNSTFGDQLSWLEADLATVNRTQTPWVIVGGHRPIYSSAITFQNHTGSTFYPILVAQAMQAVFEPLFYKYQVDLFLCGHVHAYERQYPVYANQTTGTSYVNPKSTVYIVAGAAGNIEYHETNYDYDLIPNWTAFSNDTAFGFGTLTFYNSSVLHWKWFEADNGELVDEIFLVKDA